MNCKTLFWKCTNELWHKDCLCCASLVSFSCSSVVSFFKLSFDSAFLPIYAHASSVFLPLSLPSPFYSLSSSFPLVFPLSAPLASTYTCSLAVFTFSARNDVAICLALSPPAYGFLCMCLSRLVGVNSASSLPTGTYRGYY